jgi:DNA-binding CsgD family transcriptional regulator
VILQLVQQGRAAHAWQVGPVRRLPETAALERMRTARVYSQADMPGAQDPQAPLRALRWTTGPDGFAVLFLHRRDRDFRAADTAQLSRLAPYLGPAMASWRALGQDRARAALERRIARDLGAFWLLLTPSGRVIDMAAELRDRLPSLAPLRLQPNGWLDFCGTGTAQAFRQALAAAQAASGAPGVVDLSREPPLQMVIREEAFAGERLLVAILRQGPSAGSLPLAQVASHFGLSRSEARLTMLLCDGFSLQDAAQKLGWTIETTRSCSKQIFARLAVSGQPGVVRKVLGSAVWMAR